MDTKKTQQPQIIDRHEGAKYEAFADRPVKDIAKAIRGDLKKVGYRASVRTKNSSVSSCIEVTIKAFPKGTDLASLMSWFPYPGPMGGPYVNPSSIGVRGWFRPDLDAMATVRGMCEAYQQRVSEYGADYCHANFFLSVELDPALKAEAEAFAVEAELAKQDQPTNVIHVDFGRN